MPDEEAFHVRGGVSNGIMHVYYNMGADAEDAGVQFEEQWSTNLVMWNAETPPGFTIHRVNQQKHISGSVDVVNPGLYIQLRALLR